ncbi:unnamed protein product (macronuclear) [Paramecium tetraurelia]|uniref:GST C-terminal domain-containing protein n=1 Tax=Paramecium tetraurelia TaxID=5888 RepID=A0CKB6_PARTE|nr:uncharacterized protein GSPATT00000946001 [Paramecium tetraurelia]CAK71233.1 unnamed protein product [Paramecium tetraurelia]|eukprot:XP_001438630.1 hypothetical protein (macronuclear) [Paramecium tetraurelia strain d4-2]
MSHKLTYTVGNPRVGKIIVAAQLANNLKLQKYKSFICIRLQRFFDQDHCRQISFVRNTRRISSSSNAILQYVTRGKPLVGITDYQQAMVRFYIARIGTYSTWFAVANSWFWIDNTLKIRRNKKELNWKLKILENHFKKNNFLVGQLLTIADLILATYFQRLFPLHLIYKYRDTIPNYFQIKYLHFWIIMEKPNIAIKPFPLQYYQQQQQKQLKQQLPQNTQQQKAHSKDEGEEEKPIKQQCEFDLLPQSTFNIDDWKRQFLASKNFAAEFKTFWNILILKDGLYGLLNILRLNKMQRTDPHFKKWPFAIHSVYGDVPDFQICGAQIWKGTEIPQFLKDHPTFEYLQLTKLDASKPEDIALFEEYWLDQTEDESKVQGLTARALHYFR